jgi:hypothetical protein
MPPEQTPPPEPTPSFNPFTLITQVLNRLLHIETWTQAGITILLGITVFLGFLVYKYPQQLFELFSAAIHEPPSADFYMSPLTGDSQRQVNDLLKMFGGPNAMIGALTWTVNIQNNQANYVASAFLPDYQERAKGEIERRWHWPIPVLSDDPARNHIVAQLYLGRMVCMSGEDRWPIMTSFGAQEICLVPIPPEGFGLVGMIIGLWKSPIPIADRMTIETNFRSSAAQLLWIRRKPKT